MLSQSPRSRESKGNNARNMFPEWVMDVYLQARHFPEMLRKIPKNTHLPKPLQHLSMPKKITDREEERLSSKERQTDSGFSTRETEAGGEGTQSWS